MCDENHEQQISVKFLIKLRKLRLSAISYLKRLIVRILNFVYVFPNVMNGFLKTKRAPKITNIQVNLPQF